VSFVTTLLGRSEYRLGRITIAASSFYLSTDSEILRTIDHEVAHYVQFRLNRKLRLAEYFPVGRRTFIEGFATFASRITTGTIGRPVQQGLERLLAGQKVPSSVRDYALGYFRFHTIAKTSTPDFALNVGLTNSMDEWKAESRNACAKLGIPSH
jgi:hypothetical protein